MATQTPTASQLATLNASIKNSPAFSDAQRSNALSAVQSAYGSGQSAPAVGSTWNGTSWNAPQVDNPPTVTPPVTPIAPTSPVAPVNPALTTPTTPTSPTSPAQPGVIPTVDQFNAQFMKDHPQYGYNGQPNPTSLTPGQEAIAMGQGNKYKQALSGLTGKVPDNGGQAGQVIQGAIQNVNQESTAPSIVGNIMETDNNFDSILTEYDKFHSPVEQKKSLVDEYKSLSDSLGIDKINTELLNAQKIIDGTEDDIRMEVEKAGGFASDSQVQALANSRNKSLVKNYNYLLASRDNAMTQLNTMMNLTIQDRQMAEAEFDRKMNFAFKVADYKQKAIDNAKEGLNNVIKNVGYDGFLASLGGNAKTIAQTEKLLGMASGGLQKVANISAQNRAREVEKENLDIAYKRAQMNELNKPDLQFVSGTENQPSGYFNKDTGEFIPLGGGGGVGADVFNPVQLAQAQGNVQSISNLVSDPNIRTAVGPTGLARFVGRGYDIATGGRQNFIGSVEQIRSNLNLETLIGAKKRGATFGALSDQELQVLASSASKIGSWAMKDKNGNVTGYNASEKDFKRELDKINNFAKLDYIVRGGDPMDVNAQMMPDGTVWTKNSDGTITQIK